MITRNTDYSIQHLRGLSTDTKPTDVPNGSEFREMDTGKKFLYSAAGTEWIEQPSSGGGSGGGGSNIMRAVFSFNERTGSFVCDKSFEEIQTAIQNGVCVYGFVDGTGDFVYVNKLDQSLVRFSKCQIGSVTDDSGKKDYIMYYTVDINANNEVVSTVARHPLS